MSGFGTRFREQFHSALQSLWAHRMRSVLTTLGIIIGVASVITVVHLTKSLEARIMADVNKEGSHTFFLSPWMSSQVWKSGKKVRWQALDAETIHELREMAPEILLASPEVFVWNRANVAKVGEVTRRVILHAVDENGLAINNFELACGRGFTPTDRAFKLPVGVLGARLAQDLGFSEKDLGRTFTVGGQTVEAIGILKKQGDIPFVPTDDEDNIGGTDNELFVPFGSFKELWQPWTVANVRWRLQVDPRMPLPEAEEHLKTSLRRIRGLMGGDPDNFDLSTNRKQVETVEKLGRTLMLAAGGMVSISLLVGGIGVMNIMLVSVTERTREIGIRKAMGARRRSILAQFLIEAVLLCLVGGALGLFVGTVLGHALSRWLMKALGLVPPWALISALAVPGLVGLVFGLYPAAKASKLDPIEALRYE